MSGPIDFRTLPANVPVMCIPRVFPNIDEKRIRRIFDDLNMGEIDRVDIVGKTTEKGEKFNRVFVHFRKWHSNSNADTARERLINGKEIKIIYDEPWFWKISAYRSQEQTRPQQRPQQQVQRPQPRLQFDDEEEAAKPAKDEFGRDLRPPQIQRQQQQPRQQQQIQRPQQQIQRPQQKIQRQQQPRQQQPRQQQPPALAPALQVPMPVKKRDIREKKQPTLEEGEIEEK